MTLAACAASDSMIFEVESCEDGTGGAECFGSLAVVVSGLPPGLAAQIRVTGPNGFDSSLNASGNFNDLLPGEYTVSADGVDEAQPAGASPAPGGNGRVWNPRSREVRANVRKSESTSVDIDYEAISMIVMIDGLPTGLGAGVSVRGPAGFRADLAESDSLAGLRDGDYDLEADRVDSPDSAFFATEPDQMVPVASTVTSMANVAYASLSEVDVSPAWVSLAPGESWGFGAMGRLSDGSDQDVTVDWSAAGGAIAGDGTFTAGTAEGTFQIIATFESGPADTALVTVSSSAPTVTSIVVTPGSASVEQGDSQQFSAVANMSDGSQLPATVSWTATGGSVNGNGVFTAGAQSGSFEVVATDGSGLADTASVTVTDPPPATVTGIVVTPSQTSLGTGATRQFQATAQMSDGSTQAASVTWSTGTGSISAAGLLTAGGAEGTFQVVASHASGHSGSSTVTVTAPATVTGITVTPNQASLFFGDQRQFTAELSWSDGSTTVASPNWSATGGTVSGQGLYTAGSSAGNYEVVASDASGFSDTATVQVNAPPPPPSGSPDPTLLPVATTSQYPLRTDYDALDIGSIPAGGFYLDPTTGVKIYKLTSSSWPLSGPSSWGHDYSEGGNEISLPHTGETRTILVRRDGVTPWLIDFTPGVGVSNARQMPGSVRPAGDTGFTFSSNPATPYYAFSATGSQIVRFDIRTLTEVPGDGWPLSTNATFWLHQSYDDELFTWSLPGDGAQAYRPATGELKTYSGPNPNWVNEPRIDRGGRYIAMVMNHNGGAYIWDFDGDTLVHQGNGTPPFGHNASLRNLWIGIDVDGSYPPDYTAWRPDQPDANKYFGGPANASAFYGNGNWNQPNVAVNDQWALMSNYAGVEPIVGDFGWLAPGGMIYITYNGERRLLGHPYNSSSEYSFYSFVKQSPDGHYVQFTSDMNGAGRSDIFLAEVPRR